MKLYVALLLAALFSGCSATPRVNLITQQHGVYVDFNIQTEGINGLLGIKISQADTKDLLWDVDLAYFKGGRLTYGVVPTNFEIINGSSSSAKQLFPASGTKPRAFLPGKDFDLALSVQYDTVTTASMRTFYFSFSTDSLGRISAIRPVEPK